MAVSVASRASCVRVVVRSRSGLQSCLGDFLRLAVRPRRFPLLARYLLHCLSRARPSWTPYGFPYCGSLLRWWVGATAGAAISNFSLLPTSGVHPQSVSLSSLSPTLPQQQPRVPASAGPLWSAWTMTSIRTAKLFTGDDSFIGNDKFTPSPLTRSSDNFPCSRHASADPQLICLLSAGAAHLTLVVWGGRLASYLYSVHKSDFKSRTPVALYRQSGVLSNSKSLSSQWPIWPS